MNRTEEKDEIENKDSIKLSIAAEALLADITGSINKNLKQKIVRKEVLLLIKRFEEKFTESLKKTLSPENQSDTLAFTGFFGCHEILFKNQNLLNSLTSSQLVKMMIPAIYTSAEALETSDIEMAFNFNTILMDRRSAFIKILLPFLCVSIKNKKMKEGELEELITFILKTDYSRFNRVISTAISESENEKYLDLDSIRTFQLAYKPFVKIKVPAKAKAEKKLFPDLPKKENEIKKIISTWKISYLEKALNHYKNNHIKILLNEQLIYLKAKCILQNQSFSEPVIETLVKALIAKKATPIGNNQFKITITRCPVIIDQKKLIFIAQQVQEDQNSEAAKKCIDELISIEKTKQANGAQLSPSSTSNIKAHLIQNSPSASDVSDDTLSDNEEKLPEPTTTLRQCNGYTSSSEQEPYPPYLNLSLSHAGSLFERKPLEIIKDIDVRVNVKLWNSYVLFPW